MLASDLVIAAETKARHEGEIARAARMPPLAWTTF
jgi:hypothetical protein